MLLSSESVWGKEFKPLRWYGGKAGYGKGVWIAGLLPWDKNSTYVETHGGMAGVLGSRAPVKHEVFNDIDPRVINWWEQLRTYPDEFAWHVQCCPHSRKLHERARQAMDDKGVSDFDRAVAFHVVALQSIAQDLGRKTPQWSRAITPTTGSKGRWRSERVAPLAERFLNVQLECGTAEELLERLADNKLAVVYIDPPYYSADTLPYRFRDQDISVLTNLTLAQKGKVSISGYGNEWDHLGWQRHEKEVITRVSTAKKGVKATARTEVLWTNYDAQTHGSAAQSMQPSMFNIS